MDPLEQYTRIAAELDDFWGRRAADPRYNRPSTIFGHPFILRSNDETLLAALERSARQFSRAEALDLPPFQVQIIVQTPRTAVEPPPDDLTEQIWYTGSGDWLMLRAGPWGHAYVDLARGEATAVIAPELAARPDLVSRALLNTILLNFCLHHGYGLLQAAFLVRDGRGLLLIAPGDSDRAAVALQLVLDGFRLVTADSVHLSPYGALLCGYPVGTMVLREEILTRFPQVHAYLRREHGRTARTFTLDLRQYDPRLVVDSAWPAGVIDIFLLEHHDEERTTIVPADDDEVWEAVLRSSMAFDDAAVWQRNLARITPLLARARAHHLTMGRDLADVVTAVHRLWDS
jgi:hypothetical protein